MGTVDYVAPEQIEGKAVDARADIYSLGCVFYECLTGVAPLARDDDLATLWAHLQQEPPRVTQKRPDVPISLDEVIATALAKAPDERFGTCGAFLSAISRAVATPQIELRGTPTRHAQHSTTVGATSELDSAPDDEGEPRATRRPAAARSLRGRRRLAATVLAVIAGAIATALALGVFKSDTVRHKSNAVGQRIPAELAPVPTNRVNGVGDAFLRLDGNVARINLTTTGLVAGNPHLMHIHADGLGKCPPGAVARRHNGHLAISTHDGVAFYGPAVTSLTTSGDTSVASFLDFARFPAVGRIRYRRTLRLAPDVAARVRSANAVLVVHGIDYNKNGIYDGVLDRSELNANFVGEATAPALCGAIVPAEPLQQSRRTHALSVRSQGSPEVELYRVSLAVQTPAVQWPEIRWRRLTC